MGRKASKVAPVVVAPVFRVRFVIDPEGAFEECNGKGEPLTEGEYAKNQCLACPDHPRAGSKVLNPGTSPNLGGCAVCGLSTDRYVPVDYAEYLAWYGNPDKHIYLECEVEKQCPCCKAWEHVGGTGGIDFMEDAPELDAINCWYSAPAEVEKLPGYLREVAEEDLREARAHA